MTNPDEINKKFNYSSEMLSAIFELNPDAIVLTTVSNGKIIDCNQEFLNLNGYSREEVIGHTVVDLNLYSLEERQAYINNIQSKKTISDYEMEYLQKDGSSIYILYSARIITVNGEQLILNVGKNITERKKAEEALKKNETRLSAYIKASSDVVYRMSSDWSGMYQLRGKDFIPDTCSPSSIWMNKYIHPDDQQYVQEVIKEAIRTKSIFELEHRVLQIDGTLGWTFSRAIPILDENGEIIEWFGAATDITEQKKAEKREQELLEKEKQLTEELQSSNEELQSTTKELQESNEKLNKSLEELSKSESLLSSITNSSSDVIYIKDRQSRWIFANPALEHFIGRNADELLGKNDLEIYSDPEIGKTILENDSKIMDSGKEEILEELVEAQDGMHSFISVKTPRFNREGQVIGIIGISHDITKRKKAEEALHKSQTELKRAQQIAHIGSWTWDIIADKVTWSDESYHIYGLAPGEVEPSYELFLKFIVPEDRERVDQEVKEAIDVGKKYNITYNIIRQDGIHRIVTSENDFITDDSGKVIKMYGTNQDITERKKAEEALNQSQKLLYDIINGFPSPIFVKDIEGRFLIINNKLEELLGVKNEELKGKTDYDLITKELAEDYRANDQKVLEEGKAMTIEEEADLIDGHHTFIANKFPIYDINGKPYGVGSISTDITERKLLEEKIQKLADVVESSNDAIITKSLEGIITSWNKGAEKIYDYNAEEVIGQNISILAPNSLKDEISQLIEKIKQGKQIEHYETLRVKKNGTLINVSITLSPIFDASGKLIAISTIARDITENKKAEEKTQELLEKLQSSEEELTASNEELQATSEELKTTNEELHLQMDFEVAAKRELEEIAIKLRISNKELEQFAYVASHDLQEPLRMVTSFTQLLERRYKNKLDKEADEYIGFIVEGSKRMKYLINDLLEFSRLNTQSREFESVLLKITLEDVLRNLTASITENNAQITHDPLPAIRGDPSQINQLLQNLITNAIKFHGDEPPKIHISAEESNGEWIIAVSDEGIGIDPEHQEQIFRIFKRLHTREEYAGTGIGLAICKRIIDKHNGQIWVESELGKGSTFYFTIPKN
jgi:PAS domain S-box-containing protein